MQDLLEEIRKCTICEKFLLDGVNPVLAGSENSRIVIIGQAPGRKVHESGVPWDDKSGERLRDWLGVSKTLFYDPGFVALLPMGFCYPGKGRTGDLPPRKECAPQWHEKVLTKMNSPQLIILIGAYAQNYYLPVSDRQTLTDRIKDYKTYLPNYFVLPHPSPRNNIWLKKNSWFEEKLLPDLRNRVKLLIKDAH